MLKIRKKASGKFRTLHNPDNDLRLVQNRILTRILSAIQVPDYIHAFEPGKSVPLMSALHSKKNLVISLDIKDFFPSISQRVIREMLTGVGIGLVAARTVSELCTYKAFLPQGALTSPKVSNLVVASTFGPGLLKYCQDNSLTLSVYADDITVSTDRVFKDRLESAAFIKGTIEEITKQVHAYGFRINRDKTKVMFRSTRQWVCGAVVNEKPNMLRRERLKLRAIAHNCEKNGIPSEAAKSGMTELAFIRKYLGRMNWLCQLNPELGNKIQPKFKALAKLYQQKFPEFEIPELAYSSDEGHEASLELLPEHGSSPSPLPPTLENGKAPSVPAAEAASSLQPPPWA